MIGPEERDAVLEVLDSGTLSGFLAGELEGGPSVRACEEAFAAYYGCHAVAVNSASTGLIAALRALGIRPGDEVIVPPFTMSATAAAVLHCGATPVFADIEDRTYGLDPESVWERLTRRTWGIIAVHLFGHPARMNQLRDIAAECSLSLVEDAAQSPGAEYHGRLTGTIGDIGVLSLNRHKIIQCGEGGICLTKDEDLAQRLRLIRNHGEVRSDLLSFNFRMTEIEAAIARVQLSKLDRLLYERRAAAEKLADQLGKGPVVEQECSHSYYLFAVKGEGPRYAKPLYHHPVFAPYGDRWWCPVAERVWRELAVLDPQVVVEDRLLDALSVG